MEKLEREILAISEKLAAALKRHFDFTEIEEFPPTSDEHCYGFLKFTFKEISKMPKHFKDFFRAEGCTVHFRKRIRGKNSCSYEARYRRHGYNISVSATTIELLKERFVQILNGYEKNDSISSAPSTFNEFAEFYFENFRKRKVCENTLKTDIGRYKKHILPAFGSLPLRKITPGFCQKFIDNLISAGKSKTAEEVTSLLNCIFKNAIAHYLIERNPLSMIYLPRHERKHGNALSINEENYLLHSCLNTPYFTMFAVALYTGLRPNEYKSARIDGEFIISINSKRKNHSVVFKKIPISSKLKVCLNGISELKFYGVNRIRERFHKIFPDKKLYDLRTTFYTRCRECGVAEPALMEFMGHSGGKLSDSYTDLSDEFLLNEGKKINY